ncbi:hypothetical protein PFISCL1PPCAC_17420, partial [Pristionchus fissidentatus]
RSPSVVCRIVATPQATNVAAISCTRSAIVASPAHASSDTMKGKTSRPEMHTVACWHPNSKAWFQGGRSFTRRYKCLPAGFSSSLAAGGEAPILS